MNNYYFALGIEKDADLEKIKKAYRTLCKKYHPDLASAEQKNTFLDIQEAYETLSDHEKRRKYDLSLAAGTAASVPVNFTSKGFRQQNGADSFKLRPYSSLGDDFFDRFVAGFFENSFSGSKELYSEELFCELILSPAEAASGGEFPLELPFQAGRSLLLHVPAGISSGAEAKVPLEGIGLKAAYLNIEIIIAG